MILGTHTVACITLQSSACFASVFGPSGLHGATEQLASLCGTDISPACGTQTDCRSTYGRRRELPRRYFQEFERQVEQRFRRHAAVSHDRAQTSGPSGAKSFRDLPTNRVMARQLGSALFHTCARISDVQIMACWRTS